MSDPIFVKTRYQYDSYVDFWKLVELSGFQTVFVDEMDLWSQNTYILSPMNGEFRPYMEIQSDFHAHSCTIYHWNLERPGGSGGLAEYRSGGDQLVEQGYIDKNIVSDVALASECGENYVYVPLGSHADFGVVGSYDEKEYDFIHLSCYSSNRSWLFHSPNIPRSILCGYSVASNGWGEERHRNLMKSRFMLCTHQDKFPFIEPLRYALAAAYGLPIIAEYSHSTSPYYKVPMFKVEEFCSVAKGCVNLYAPLYRMVGLEMMVAMTGVMNFRSCLEKFL